MNLNGVKSGIKATAKVTEQQNELGRQSVKWQSHGSVDVTE
jgi:hypothetical protein